MAMSRSVGGNGPNAPQSYELSDWSTEFPKLWAHLVEEVWDDGTKRTVSTLLLLGEDGWIKGCLNDRGEGRVAWVAAKTVEDVLNGFERKLGNGGLEWRRVESRPGGRR